MWVGEGACATEHTTVLDDHHDLYATEAESGEFRRDAGGIPPKRASCDVDPATSSVASAEAFARRLTSRRKRYYETNKGWPGSRRGYVRF